MDDAYAPQAREDARPPFGNHAQSPHLEGERPREPLPMAKKMAKPSSSVIVARIRSPILRTR